MRLRVGSGWSDLEIRFTSMKWRDVECCYGLYYFSGSDEILFLADELRVRSHNLADVTIHVVGRAAKFSLTWRA